MPLRAWVGLVFGVVACTQHDSQVSSQTSAPVGSVPSAVSSAPASSAAPQAPVELAHDFAEDILSTKLNLDVAKMEGRATIVFKPAPSGLATFDVQGLAVKTVTSPKGEVRFRNLDGKLDVDGGPLAQDGKATIEVTYAFFSKSGLEGWVGDAKLAFLWPQFCGNLFPCKSDPSDGTKFELEVVGLAPPLVAVYPHSIDTEAPSYMVSIAAGEYTKLDIGKTTAGTQISGWYLPGEAPALKKGTAQLVQVFDFFEKTYGPYAFGKEAGTVSAAWPKGGYGGMEHHPFWHVARNAIGSGYIQAHEAAHGWFGNGVRLKCWQDFTLSEGTATYIAARALDAIGSPVWDELACDLSSACNGKANTVAVPETCEPVDMIKHPLWSMVPYMKGAYFYRQSAEVLGVEALDRVLGAFYKEHVGKAASMNDMIAAIRAAAPNDEAKKSIDRLTTTWLRQIACPIDDAASCKRRKK